MFAPIDNSLRMKKLAPGPGTCKNEENALKFDCL